MGEQSKIEWCDSTVNLWQGCDKVSPGCAHCYAAAMDARFNGGLNWKGLRTDKRKSGTALAMKLDRKAAKLGIRYRVFNGSVNDWLDDAVPIEWLADLLALIHSTPNLDWLLLSKRPENWKPRLRDALECMSDNMRDYDEPTYKFIREWIIGNPLANVWIGTTVENQEMADKRIPQLLQIPAKVRFLSCEPLLGPVDLERCGKEDRKDWIALVDWVICGGESGPKARPMHPDWARSLRDQCAAAGVPFFMKQMGGTRKPFAPIPDDLEIKQFPTP